MYGLGRLSIECTGKTTELLKNRPVKPLRKRGVVWPLSFKGS